MIKNILILITCTLFFASCDKKTDEIFDKTVDERLTEALTNYQNYLTAAPGWKLFVYPKGLESQDITVGGLTYYLKFTNTNRVTMVSDFSTDIASVPKESGYRLKALQRPSLIFDTYSYMHIPADPDPNVSFSPTGKGGDGFGTDFNFSFTEAAPKDTIHLQGNFNKSSAVLIKATQAEMDAAFSNGRLGDIIGITQLYQVANPFLYFPASPTLNAGIGFDFNKMLITFSYLDAGALVNTTIGSSFTTYGIHLQNPTTIGNATFQDIFWDDAKHVYYIMSGGTRVEFANSAAPIVTLPLTDIGNQYTTITVPPGANLPNESPLFITKYNAARVAILNGPYALRLDDMDFVFNAATKTMSVNAYVYQGNNGFLAQYNYTYTIDGAGVFKFTKATQNGNAALIATDMNNILGYIGNDHFKLDGISTSVGFLGLFSSQENPAFFFSGNLY
ncbi:MAG: DUF4302 domain-containing protein [Ferruginibacter sp.]